MLTTIVNIQPKDSGGGGGETRESIVHRLATEMEEKLPPDYVPHEVSDAGSSCPSSLLGNALPNGGWSIGSLRLYQAYVW